MSANRFSTIARRALVTGVLALGALAITAAPARADWYCQPPPCYSAPTYTTYRVPYTQCVYWYDHCGRLRHGYRTYYRTVRVPVSYSHNGHGH